MRARGGVGGFFRSLFSRGEDTRTRPRAGLGERRMASSGRLGGRQAAASSLGSLQSYATSTIRGNGPIPGCLTQQSTSEVGVRRRVEVNREIDSQLVFDDQDGLMSRSPERFAYPRFCLAEFGGRDNWFGDVFVLPHNAIRWEIMDLYTIVASLQKRWAGLVMLDVWELSQYWMVFEVFVGQYFEIEDQIIFPFLGNAAGASADFKKYQKVVKYNRERLERMLMGIGNTLELFNKEKAATVMPKVYEMLSEFLPKLLDYMEQQEEVLPKVFKEYCEPEDRLLVNRASANFLVRAANGRDGIAILTRWIEDPMILQMWKNENLSTRAQSSHKRWISSLESNHVDIARRFQRRMRSMPKVETTREGMGMGDRVEEKKGSVRGGSFKNGSRRMMA